MKTINKKYLIFILVITLVLVAFSIFYLNKEEGNTVRISYNNEVIEELSLDVDQTKEYNFDGNFNIVEINENTVKVSEANCSNQTCVHTKEVSSIGDVIACLPHKFIVEVI